MRTHGAHRRKHMYETFDELGIQPEILQAVKDMGFEEPTPIQKVFPERI